MPKSTVHGGVTNEALEQSQRTGQPPEEFAVHGEHGPELESPAIPDPQVPPAEQDAETPPTADNGKEPGPARPAVNDPKERWIEYAVARGWPQDDAHAATKADLIEKTKDL